MKKEQNPHSMVTYLCIHRVVPKIISASLTCVLYLEKILSVEICM
jgi:hypothetical protein